MATQITPETDLEGAVLNDPRLGARLEWGAPRPGLPEGRVADHAAAILAAIAPDDPLRTDLRLLAIVHDAFKAEVQPDLPWSPDNDHAVLARRFAERYTADERLLTTLELHDEPYWIWRNVDQPERALRRLLDGLPDTELFARFVELDAANEGKDLTFLWWFRRTLAVAGRLPGHRAVAAVGTGEDVLYVKAFATAPQQQPPPPAQRTSSSPSNNSGWAPRGRSWLRVWLVWRWHGTRRELIERDADVVRKALAAHPIFADLEPVEARILHAASGM